MSDDDWQGEVGAFSYEILGYGDLSLSLGIPLQLEDADFRAAVAHVVASCRQHGKAAGCLIGDPEPGRAWIAQGFRMVLYSGDIWLFGNALAAGIERCAAERARRLTRPMDRPGEARACRSSSTSTRSRRSVTRR